MAMLMGKEAKVKVGETVVVKSLSSISVSDGKSIVKVDVFDDTNKKIVGMGTRDVNGTISGYMDVDDTTGQDILNTAYENETTVSGFRLFISADTYYHADGAGDTDGTYIISRNFGAEAGDGIISVEFGFEVGGDWSEGTV